MWTRAAEAKASLNMARGGESYPESVGVDAKLGDLPVARLKGR